MKRLRPLRSIIAIFLICLGMAMPPASADILVLTSTDTIVTSGTILIAGDTVHIRDGAELVLLFEDGHEETIRGPETFTHPKTGQAAQSDGASFLSELAAILKKIKGERRLGAIRSEDDCPHATPLLTWSDIATEWTDGCQAAAVNALDARTKTVSD